MDEEVRWIHFLKLSLLMALAILLEYFSIFLVIIPDLITGNDIVFSNQKVSINHIIIVIVWAIYCGMIVHYSRKKYNFPGNEEVSRISKKNWLIALICLLSCKVITFIDWRTLKIIGEADNKEAYLFITQYLYYFAEVAVVLLIIMFGQKAWETRNNKKSYIPAGGIFLMFTWGIFHFVSRGKGIELWNGISTMIFSFLSGIIYVRLEKKTYLSYLFIAVGYLL